MTNTDADLWRDCWFLTGATASGKSAVGIELAQLLNAEIVSLDSMAVYRGMDIGTAKPTLAEQQIVGHHLIDLVEPDQEYSVANYVADAERCRTEIQGRGYAVLFVGGTALYLKALLRGLFEGPEADWKLRRKLAEDLAEHGAAALHARLAEVDPVTATRLHLQDTRRIIRALEVFEATGIPISQLQQQWNAGLPAADRLVFVLHWPRPQLQARINARVEAMFAAGLVEEVQSLLAAGKTFGRTAAQAVGYREVLEHLAGERNLSDTIELVKTRTRQFAKRQETWFRSLSECRMLPMTAGEHPAEIARRIVSWAKTGQTT